MISQSIYVVEIKVIFKNKHLTHFAHANQNEYLFLRFRRWKFVTIAKTHVKLLVLIFLWKKRYITTQICLNVFHSQEIDQLSLSLVPVMMFLKSVVSIKSVMFLMVMLLHYRNKFLFCVMNWFMYRNGMMHIYLHGLRN